LCYEFNGPENLQRKLTRRTSAKALKTFNLMPFYHLITSFHHFYGTLKTPN
jgi:hypothetical protein